MDNYRLKKSKDSSFCQRRFGTERERGIRKPSWVKRRDAFTEGLENRGLIPRAARKSALHGRDGGRGWKQTDRSWKESVRSALVRHIKRRCGFEPIRMRRPRQFPQYGRHEGTQRCCHAFDAIKGRNNLRQWERKKRRQRKETQYLFLNGELSNSVFIVTEGGVLKEYITLSIWSRDFNPYWLKNKTDGWLLFYSEYYCVIMKFAQF